MTQALPVAASLAVQPLLEGPLRRLSQTLAVAHAVGYGPLAVVDTASARPPHAVVTGDPGLVATLAVCRSIVVGGGAVRAGGMSLAVARWWDPRPRPARTTAAALARRLPLLGVEPVDDLCEMPLAGARQLLGAGAGLTPRGDDVLVGFLAARAVLDPALRAAAPSPSPDAAAAWIVTAAGERTTDLSARLLWHAARGEVMAPVGAVIRALSDGIGLQVAVERLSLLGASSGTATLSGIASGVAALLRGQPRRAASIAAGPP